MQQLRKISDLRKRQETAYAKTLFFMWALAVVFFYISVTNAFSFGTGYLGSLIWVIICIYAGCRQYVEYHEKPDDKRMIREYPAAKTADTKKLQKL